MSKIIIGQKGIKQLKEKVVLNSIGADKLGIPEKLFHLSMTSIFLQ